MTRLATLVALVTMLALLGCGGERHAPVSRLYDELGISLPCSLKHVEQYPDGGSIGGLMVDAERESLLFAWDGSERPLPPAPENLRGTKFNAWAESVMLANPRLAYIGADHPSGAGAKPLARGSEAESVFLVAVRFALADSTLPPLTVSRAAGMAAFLEHQREAGPTPYPVPQAPDHK